MTMPTVSVIIPTFNAEAFVAEALTSVCAQTLRDIEIIVVDDGSSDGTVGVAEAFSGRLALTVVRQANAGPSAARNAGIRLARGRYCAFLDADDVMRPGLLETQARVLDADPALGMVITDVETFDENGTIHSARWRESLSPGSALLDALLLDNFVTTSAVMAPTSCLLEAGLFPEGRRVAEDYELWLRLASRWKVAFIDQPLVRYRYRGDGLSADRLYSAECALDVVQGFWSEHAAYRRTHRTLAHRSLARHLANAGIAASRQRRRCAAAAYLLRSLRHRPIETSTWKALVKTTLPARARPRSMAAARHSTSISSAAGSGAVAP